MAAAVPQPEYSYYSEIYNITQAQRQTHYIYMYTKRWSHSRAKAFLIRRITDIVTSIENKNTAIILILSN